ncbi:hypothetical protein PV11_00765 [Exophiala sideris]|uniref:Uncharacterized protein n=1 Tax=Exophiala sideris TaxID=1016849 RepID=A0A0D1YQM7_9EURO|nr:hypothetical protein PV11_00765 [Exophiala sideris]
MSRRSLESERPIMAPSLASSKRTSKRYSTYSASPSFSTTASNTMPSATMPTPETGIAEISKLTRGLDRLENKHLQQQRYVPNQKKADDLSKLSLGAKLERALGRRMSDQDAVFRVKRPVPKAHNSFPAIDEKMALKV